MSGRSELERFALAVHAEPGVASACLLLQDRSSIDVNLVLFAAAVGVRGGAMDAGLVAAAHRRVDEWHDEVVRPLRVVRRRLKNGPAPAPDERTTALRAALQAIEIEAELVELSQLDGLITEIPEVSSPDTADSAARAISAVIRHGAGREADAGELAAITTIAVAAAGVCRAEAVA